MAPTCLPVFDTCNESLLRAPPPPPPPPTGGACARACVCVCSVVLHCNQKSGGKSGKGSKGVTPKGVLALQGLEKSKLSGDLGEACHTQVSLYLSAAGPPPPGSGRMHL